MKNKTKFIWLGVLGIILILFFGWIQQETLDNNKNEDTSREATETAQVLHVFDGDTFSVRVNGKTETVRAIGIDAPETGEKYTEKECFGKESRDKAVEILSGKQVKLKGDSTQEDRDKYDRLLRYVFLEDGTFFNQLMIEEGFAKEFTFQDSIYKYQIEFTEAQNKAKNNKRGIWSECGR